MPVQRSSSKNGADKTSRKVRVALGRSEGLGDGVRKLGLKSSTVDKAHRKVRIAIGGSKGSSDVDRTKNKGSKKGKSRKGDDDAVSYVDVSEKLSEKRRRGKRDLKTHTRNEGLEAVVDWNSGRKRKRIYADPGTVEDSKSSSKSRSNVVRSYLDKGKTVPRGKDHEFKDSSRKTSLAGGSKFMGSELLDKKVRRGKMEAADKLKPVQENGLGNRKSKTRDKGKVLLATEKRDLNRRKHAVGSVEKPHKKKDQGNKSLVTDSDSMEKTVPRGKDHEFKDSSRKTSLARGSKFIGSELLDKKVRRGKMDGADKLKPVQENGLGNRKSKTSDKGKVLLATEKGDLYRRKHAFGSVEKLHKKKDQGNKSLFTDSDLMEKPKKKKRVIRIDPHDISNKRLDDEKANNGNSKTKIDLTENIDVEMSKNAQFRAIRPSPSILSFVEDNLLGRRRDIEFRKAGYNTELAAPLDNIPFSTSSERERIEIPVFRNKLEFFAAAKISSSFPSPDLPEIAFAGRSNVGKSSLLNSLTRQWGVVRTSDKPGLTQTINFFKLGSKLCLVDLPGYGFAYAKEEVKEAWEELVKEYVSTRVGLKRVCLLVDTKWGMKPRDHELIDLMERSQTKYQIVLTKTDMVFPMDVARRAMQIEENLKEKKSAVQPLMMVSSKTGAGVRSLRTVLANVARLVRR